MKITNKTKVLDGIIIDVYNATAETKDQKFPVQLFEHPGATCVAASPDGIKFLMVEQFRFGLGYSLLEFPAGKIDDPNEDPSLGALRELREETGYQAEKIVSLGHIHPAGAYIDEVVHLYYAEDLTYIGQNLDDTEELEVQLYSLDEITTMILENRITDAKTIALTMKLKAYLQ